MNAYFPLHLNHPLCFRSCGLSPHHVRGLTRVQRPASQSRAAGLILKAQLHVLERGKKADRREEILANMARAFKQHSESDSRLQT